MKPASFKFVRFLVVVLLAVALCAAIVGVWFRFRMARSLPRLEGTVHLAGLAAKTSVERDSLGVVTLRGATRLDVVRALGYVHAQDRFFQMDCSRRQAAGTLAALIGKTALAHDRRVRIHEFGTLASRTLAQLPADQQAVLRAYADGVNAGLADLGAKPFEYLLLRTTPEAWRPEDSLLVLYAQGLELEEGNIVFEHSLATLSDSFGKSAVAYFAPAVGPDDAALDGSTAPLAPMPSDHLIDIRKRVYEYEDGKKHASLFRRQAPDLITGSNAFALSGAHTASGAALLANDLHRTLAVPNAWYRASLAYPTASGNASVTGITLPGLPLILAGSNGRVAWGLTNACADVADLVVVNPASGPGTYMDGDTPRLYEKHTEVIQVRGGSPESVDYFWTNWGPVIGANADKRDLALKWTLQDPQALNLAFAALETAASAGEAMDIARRSGLPVQTFTAVDDRGDIGLTLCGFLPRRAGYDGRLPTTWAFGDRKWIGFLPPEQVPVWQAPVSGRLWSANQRLAQGAALGDGGYALPYRAGRDRDDLAGMEKVKESELLGALLDAHAPFLDRWQKQLMAVLTPEATSAKRDRAQMRAAAESWTGEAATVSVGYHLVSSFRRHVAERVLPVVFEPCYDVYPEFDFSRFNYEPALWDMVQKRPPHLLAQEYGSWDDLLLAAVDDVIAEAKKEQGAVKAASWGEHNRADIRHPLARLFPGPLGAWLKMPADQLPGDDQTPRVQAPSFGAAVRMVVTPGQEKNGVLEMACGQSGHPLSPFFRAGHEAWVNGSASPFLPGVPLHTLWLEP